MEASLGSLAGLASQESKTTIQTSKRTGSQKEQNICFARMALQICERPRPDSSSAGLGEATTGTPDSRTPHNEAEGPPNEPDGYEDHGVVPASSLYPCPCRPFREPSSVRSVSPSREGYARQSLPITTTFGRMRSDGRRNTADFAKDPVGEAVRTRAVGLGRRSWYCPSAE